MQNNNNNPQGPQTPPPAPQNTVPAYTQGPNAPRRQTELRQPNPSPSNSDPLLPWAHTTLNLASGNGNGNGGHSHS